MQKLLIIVFLFLFNITTYATVNINIPKIILKNIPTTIRISVNDSIQHVDIQIDKKIHTVNLTNGKGELTHTFTKKTEVKIESFKKTANPIPLWFSILPPLIAILLALVFKEVISSLFIGVLVGTSIIETYASNNILLGMGKGLLSILDEYILKSLADEGHLSIIIFSMLIGAMVNIVTENGGMKGVVNKLSVFAKTRRSGQFATWLLGISIFFDDYANTLVVGNTMRPITDKLRISREKLAYLVDSTAAPIAAIAFITTWIGAELSYIQSGIDIIGIPLKPYNVFLNSLAYSFYPIFALLFMLILIHRNADFGPMLKCEQMAKQNGIKNIKKTNYTNELNISEHINAKWFNAAIPVLIVIIGTFVGLLYTGWDSSIVESNRLSFSQKLSHIIGNSDSYKALLWSSLVSCLTAVILTVSQKILTLKKSIDSILNGFKTMFSAIIILIFAWSIALVTRDLHTADFISKIIIDTHLSPIWIPLITFILSALVSFSTGTSWGTMAILFPLILPASWLIAQEYNYEYNASLNIFYNSVASVLAGSVLGDHCSPISDTTILSSLASSCSHIDHVRTQLPYAITVGGVAAFVGVLPASLSVPAYITFPLGVIVLYIIVRLFGKKV